MHSTVRLGSKVANRRSADKASQVRTPVVSGPYDRAANTYRAGAVAHERRECSEAGLIALRSGGNAVDAAVAIGFAACVVMPAWTTIAGSGFMLIRLGNGTEPVAIEFPPRAPLAARADMYELVPDNSRTEMIGVSAVVDNANTAGPNAIGVPAVVAGLCEGHSRFGRLSLEDVLAPAIDLAERGFPVVPELQMLTLEALRDLRRFGAGLHGTLLTSEGLPLDSTDPSGAPTVVVQKELGRRPPRDCATWPGRLLPWPGR